MVKAYRALFPIIEETVELDLLAVIITAASSRLVMEEGEAMAGVNVKAVPETFRKCWERGTHGQG